MVLPSGSEANVTADTPVVCTKDAPEGYATSGEHTGNDGVAFAGKCTNVCSDPHRTVTSHLHVHNAHLYTDLLDAADWTDVLEREREDRRREALALFREETEAERNRRDASRQKAAADAKAMEQSRRRREMTEKDFQATELFRSRTEAFFRRHRNLISQWKAIDGEARDYEQRLRQRLHRAWDETVFSPTQAEISALVDDRCNGNNLSTWKRRKEEMWRSFLRESNRYSKLGGRAGVTLDAMDDNEYNPIAQTEAATLRYRRRVLPSSDVDARRAEAQHLEDAYTLLALDYRDEERKSRTGILIEKTTNTGGAKFSLCDSSSSLGPSGWYQADDVVPTLPPPPPAYRNTSVPRMHVPFLFPGASASPQLNNAAAKTFEIPTRTHSRGSAPAFITVGGVGLRRGDAGDAACSSNIICDSSIHYCTGKQTVGLRDTILECEREVMPLPLGGRGSSAVRGATVLPWIDSSSAVPAPPREAYLPVQQWSKEAIVDTVYGHYVTPDGEAKPSVTRRQVFAKHFNESLVMFDHYDYPKEAEHMRFGKRMW